MYKNKNIFSENDRFGGQEVIKNTSWSSFLITIGWESNLISRNNLKLGSSQWQTFLIVLKVFESEFDWVVRVFSWGGFVVMTYCMIENNRSNSLNRRCVWFVSKFWRNGAFFIVFDFRKFCTGGSMIDKISNLWRRCRSIWVSMI